MRRFLLCGVILCMGSLALSACGASYAQQAADSGYYPEMDQVMVVQAVGGLERSASVGDDDDYAYASGPILTAEAEEVETPIDKPEPPDARVPRTQRIVLYSASLLVYVLEIPVAIARTQAIIDEANGWVQASTSNSVTMRVPAESFKDVLVKLKELGEVGQENVVGQDVTEEFFDLEIRLKNAIEMRDRYVELLAKATTVEETLKIEAELGRVTGEIESFKGRLKYLSENARFSSITISFSERAAQTNNKHVALPIEWLSGISLQQLYSRGYY